MKAIFVFLTLSIFILSSCVKYSQPKLLSLSGEYVVDKITYGQIDNTNDPNNMVFYPGDLYVNPNETHPFDTIPVGFYKIHLDYTIISFSPSPNPDGSTTWNEKYLYDVYNQTNTYLGDLAITMNGTTRVFSIIEDGLENLVLRTKGQWVFGSSGADESITLYLTRIGP